MNKITNLIKELDGIVPAKSKHMVVESRAAHIIASALHLTQLIRESYDEPLASDLIKRLHRSIITENDQKFMRKIKEVRKSNESK